MNPRLIPMYLSAKFPLISLCAASLFLTSCIGWPPKNIKLPESRLSARALSRSIDEENLEYFVAFRNQGNQIISFDYTIADAPTVPHIDAGGPNSGLVENLYPGASVELKNPYKTNNVYLALGKVVVGKLTPEQFSAQYHVTKPANTIPANELPPL